MNVHIYGQDLRLSLIQTKPLQTIICLYQKIGLNLISQFCSHAADNYIQGLSRVHYFYFYGFKKV